MFDRIKTRLASEEGFTLIELLVVIVILGILVAIAVPAYLSFKGNAQDAASKSNVRSAIPAAEQYNITNGSYTGLTGNALRTASPGLAPLVKGVSVNGGAGYCLQDNEGNGTFDYVGGNPGAAMIAGAASTIQAGTCTIDVGTAATT